MNLMREAIDMIREGCAETARREPVRRMSEGQRIDAWKALRADFEKRTREILGGSDFADSDVKFILDALDDNSPSIPAWEEFIVGDP